MAVDLLSAIEKPVGEITITDTPQIPTPTPEVPVTYPVSDTPEVTPEVKADDQPKAPEIIKEGEIPETTEIPDYLKKWNELSGGKFTFDSDDKVKEFFDTYEKINGEYQGLKGISDKMKEIEEFVREKGKMYDPVAIVGGKDNYRKMAIAAELSNKSTNSDVQRLAVKIVSSDLNGMDDLDVISLVTQLQAPKLIGKDKIAKEVFLSEIGVDTEDLDFNNLQLSDHQIGKIAIKAAEFREKMSTKIASVKVPDAENPIKDIITKFETQNTKTEELKGKWKEAENQIKGSLTKLDFQNGFEYDIKEDVSQIVDQYLTEAARKGLDPSDANSMQKVVAAVKEEIWNRDRSKILAARDSFMENKIRAEMEKKYENRQPLSTPNTPVLTDDKSTAQEAYRRAVGI